ncbi:oligosaccharide flippase family protein [Phenylobacterium deserti]|uniref:Lipopolysaccharide biosynthesis protein n=1 Tax=Phenylobacterium deserti TaxID=1914756 RepID=A0A328A839_9CAUL|nr:oligosaccharide flippase family protein [Phenylobacterium deserti]RAK50702.1 hypothetical protein DJ018_18295 [Phenylobacterium deserti]
MTAAGHSAPGAAAKPARTRAQRTSLGALALSASSALRLTLQFAMLPVLARLVGPTEYGLVALAMPFILLANVVADGGMSYALGRRREASPTLESTVFWLGGAIGLTLALICCAIAYPLSALLDQPRLPGLLIALSPVLLLNSLTPVSNGRIIREGRFAVFAAGDCLSAVVAAATALTAAMNGAGAWSLVAQQLALWITKFVWVTWKGGATIRRDFHFAEAKPLLIFGFSTIGAMLSDFAARNLDTLIIGGVLGATSLGFYSMAYQIIRVPDMLIVGPLYLYIFTAVSRTGSGGRPEAIHELALASVRLSAAGLMPLFVGLALVADLAVSVVLGSKWLGAIPSLQLLGGAGFAIGMCAMMATNLMGRGRAGLQFRLSLLLATTTVLTVAGSARFGLGIVSATLSLGLLSVMTIYAFCLARDLKMPFARLASGFVPAAVGCAAMAGAVLLARRELAQAPPLLELLAMIVLGALAYAGALWLVAGRRLIGDVRAFARAQADKPTQEAAAGAAEIAETSPGLV